MPTIITIVCLALALGLTVPSESEHTERDLPWDSELELTAPVTLVWAGDYSDGGTVGFTVRDSLGHELSACLDGRMGEASYPPRFFLGATHPTFKNAVPIEAWSRREEALLDLAAIAIAETLSSSHERAVIEIGTATALPDSVSVGMWQFVRHLVDRRAALRAIRSGEPADLTLSLEFFRAEHPLQIRGISSDSALGTMSVSISDSGGMSWWVELGLSQDMNQPAHVVVGSDRYSAPLVLEPWSFESRATLMLVSAALSDTQSFGNLSDSLSRANSMDSPQSSFADLVDLLEQLKESVRGIDNGLGR